MNDKARRKHGAWMKKILDEWLETKLKEQEDPLITAPGAVIAKRYRGKQIIRWFFLEDHLKENSRTSVLHGPRKWSTGILGAAPLPLAYPLVEKLQGSFPTYTFCVYISPEVEDLQGYEVSLNDIDISYYPRPTRADHIAIYDKAVSVLLELGEQQSN